MKLTLIADYYRLYVDMENLPPEAIEIIRMLNGYADENGQYYWDRDNSSLYYVIYKLSKCFDLQIK